VTATPAPIPTGAAEDAHVSERGIPDNPAQQLGNSCSSESPAAGWATHLARSLGTGSLSSRGCRLPQSEHATVDRSIAIGDECLSPLVNSKSERKALTIEIKSQRLLAMG
jgi:hypothetical protein